MKKRNKQVVQLLLFMACIILFCNGIASANRNILLNNPAADSMRYIGHASMKITTLDGSIVYIDPFAGTKSDYSDSADIVLITHEHSDHNNLSLVTQKSTCRVIRSATALVSGVYQSFTIGNIKIKAVPAYNSYHLKSECVGYVVEFDDVKIYHSGDTGLISEMADLASENLAYAFLCMDGIYTMSPEEATQAAATISAKKSIPIHTMPPPDTYSNTIVSRFTAPNKMVVLPGTTIALVADPTSVGSIMKQPSSFSLCQNYPNPFNPSTSIQFSIRSSAFVTMSIFDDKGAEVSTLIRGIMLPGVYTRVWNAASFPSGVYFCRLQAGNDVATKRLLLVK